MKKSIFQIRMKADLILNGKINKQLIHHEQNEKNSTDDTDDCRGSFAVAAKLQGSAARGSAKKYSKDHRVFLLLTLINIKKKDRT